MNQVALRNIAALVVAAILAISVVTMTTAVFARDAQAAGNTGDALNMSIFGDHGNDSVNQAASAAV
jgi:hypothetical protein